jgi:hypothetical protein
VPNWPELLPPSPGNSSGSVYLGFDVCASGGRDCPDKVILEMYERWRPLNRDCDHRAVFALTYLRTTEEFARAVRRDPRFFADGPWVNHEDAIFAELYFRAFDASFTGGSVPGAWTQAFQADDSSDETAIGDLLLGMNAHIARDLPHTLAAVGLVARSGATRKDDHNRVNYFLDRLADPLQDELGRRYDPLFTTTDAGPSPFDEVGMLQSVRFLRENAWRNAERLVNANGDGERAQVGADIESQSAGQAASIRAANAVPGYGPTRDTWCRAHNEPSFRLRIAGQGLRSLARRGKLVVAFYTDGPARFTLVGRRGAGIEAAAAKRRRKRPGTKLTLKRKVSVEEKGWQEVKLRLTKRARRSLAHRRRARIQILLRAQRGMRAQDSTTLGRRPR